MSQGILLGGSGGYGTLPEQVSGFYAARGNAQVTLTWSNPSAEYAGTLIVRKTGSYPQRPSDGVKIYKGTGTSFIDTGLTNGTQYYYRAFAYNSRGEYQTINRIAVATPVATIPISDLPCGTMIKISYDGTQTKFLIAQQGNPDSSYYDSSCAGAWIMSQDCIDSYMFDKNYKSFGRSALKQYLESTIFPKFSSALQEKMVNAMLPVAGSTVSCKLFVPSAYELGFITSDMPYQSSYNMTIDGKKSDYFLSGTGTDACAKRIAYYGGNAIGYWTRTVDVGYSEALGTVYFEYTCGEDGKLNINSTDITWGTTHGVRIEFIVPSSLEVLVQQDNEGYYTVKEE